jgi:NadR type nicotinamide-nucleotide adenylyltransferase
MEKKINFMIRIALIGPESTAKSTLSEALAKHYQTVWIQEYARTYLTLLNRKYTLEDIVTIAKKQFAIEKDALEKANRLLIVDTEAIISKVWCEAVFNTCPAWISENILSHPYDLYLLTSPDIPWVNDPLRENPTRREFFFDWYEKELKSINANYIIIKGIGDERLNNCIVAIEKILIDFQN